MLGRTVTELRATMTLPEYFSWQAYAQHKAALQARPAAPPPLPLAELGPAELARTLGGR